VLLAKHAGKRVLVLERHYTAGGLTHTFTRPGFEWDVGFHYVGQVNVPGSNTKAMVDYVTGGRMRWTDLPDVYDKMLIGDRLYEFETGAERLNARIREYFPRDAKAVDRYFATVNRAALRMGFYFAERLLPPWLARVGTPLVRRVHRPYSDRTTATVMASITRNREWAGVLTSQWGQYGLPPEQSAFGIHALVTRSFFGGTSYPVGGASTFIAAFAPGITSAQGEIVVRADVDSIIVENGAAAGVRMTDGRVIRAPLVISDAGARNTFTWLLREHTPRVEAARRAIASIPPSPGHLGLYVGLNGSDEQVGLSGTNLTVFPNGNHDENVRRAERDPAAAFPLIYFSFPSAKDPTFGERFPGRSTIELIVPVPYAWFARWGDTRWHKRGAEYDDFKARLTSRLLDATYEHFPTTRGRVAHAELSTPLSVRHFTNHPNGEIYGLAPTPERFQLVETRPRTPIRGLYLTGADVATHGVLGAIAGGIITASVALGKNLFATATKASATAFKP